MKTQIKGNYVFGEEEAVTAFYETGGFGRPRDGRLQLRFVEAAYLLSRGKIEVLKNGKELNFDEFIQFAALAEDFFELKYIVYKDLKERGYSVQSSATDFRVYPRGGKPGKTAAKSYVFVRSERMPIPFSELTALLNEAQNVRKQFILAVVDEESDITFYDVKRADAVGSFEGGMTAPFPQDAEKKNAAAVLFKERVILNDKATAGLLYNKEFFGKMMDEDRLLLSLPEALYLAENGVLNLYDMDGKELSNDEFSTKAAEIDAEFSKKYTIYKELKEKGFVPKTGFKFGTHFRVYRNFESPAKIPHSEFLLHVVSPEFEFKLPATSGAIRLANSVRKKMIYAADLGSKREYIEFERIKM
ncbi:tRNA-intron lyase [Methanimicrococcus sp. OttesenSCG-928-J09]|nr:tRNA-intron lyase [Methanimicrococcus sp. OttesenSCG-928-J09]